MILFWRIGVAMILGACVAGLYRWACRGQAVAPTFLTTLILLSTLIAMATQIIGDNVARAFSLVGALSVVRFRTVVKDTQDTAFVIFAVVVGMASGAKHLTVALVGLAVISLASFILWPRRQIGAAAPSTAEISIRVGTAPEIAAEIEQLLAENGDPPVMMSAGTAKQGTVLDLVYRVRLRPGASLAALVSELGRVPGAEGVEIRRQA